jgi:2,3-bisphosphoglycerate-independent phosphoglycerate mutase
MKYLLLIPDGMADWRIKELGNKTPLEVADKPNMDFLAKEGSCGIAKTVPDGFEPGSDIANLTILGVDVRIYYTGRGPIEALARGVSSKIVFRCNLVKVENGIMVDYSGGRISDAEARKVISALNESRPYDFVKFYAGTGYRNLLCIDRDFDFKVKTTPPHDIQGKPISPYLPKNGELADLLLELMEISKEVVPSVTDKANMIWPWGGGKMPKFPSFKAKWGVKCALISEVDLIKGIGKGLGFEVIEVEGVTGYIDTNYKGLAKAVIKCLDKFDFVMLHVEGIDEVSHEGDLEKKIEAISLYDEKIVGYIIDRIELEETRIMLLPDHPTPIELRTHTSDPVPFLLYGWKSDDVKSFDEFSCRKGRFGFVKELKLMDLMFRL